MTNVEKSIEISAYNKMTYLELENDGGVYEVDSESECYKSAMEMARWKDTQLWLLIDAIDYIYMQNDGTYVDLSPIVIDKIRFLKNQLSKQ